MKPSPARTAVPSVRTGQGSTQLTREEFGRRYGMQFYDPAFDGVKEVIGRLTEAECPGCSMVVDHLGPRTKGGGPPDKAGSSNGR